MSQAQFLSVNYVSIDTRSVVQIVIQLSEGLEYISDHTNVSFSSLMSPLLLPSAIFKLFQAMQGCTVLWHGVFASPEEQKAIGTIMCNSLDASIG